MSTNQQQQQFSGVKRLVKIMLVLSAFGLLIFAFMPEKQLVDLATVTQGDLIITVEGEGKTRIHDIYTVSTPIDGRVTRIISDAGDIVIAGKTLIANMSPANPAFLDKRSEMQAKADIEGAKAALSLANSRVKQAQAQLALDNSDYKRTKELYNDKMVSAATLEQVEIRVTMQQAEKETAIANKALMASRLKAAQAKLLQPESIEQLNNKNCQICIYSPVDGRVLRILHRSESIIPVGTALVDIGNPKDLEINIEMLSTNAVKINLGDKAFIKRWGGKEDLLARVKVIEPSGFTKISALGVEEQRVNVILTLTQPYEKWQTLGDGYRVEAEIVIDEVKQVNKIPLSSLFRVNGIWSVFKVVDGEAQLQTVNVGKRNSFFTEITKGLTNSDKIILHPSNSIEEGVKVMQR